jgi:hypothetical protein
MGIDKGNKTGGYEPPSRKSKCKNRISKMTDLEKLIQTADNLSNRLAEAAEEEYRFGVNLCLALERMSWEMLRAKDDLQEIANLVM